MTVVACLLATAAAPESRAETKVFDPFNPNTPYYDLDVNWDPPDAPGPNDHAKIPTGLTCVIRAYDGENPVGPAEAKRITIEDGGTIFMKNESALILGENGAPNTSRIDGELLAEDWAPWEGELVIAGDHTIVGDGGVIWLTKGWVVGNPPNEGPYTLTLESDCIDPCNPAASCALLWHGSGILEAPIVNDAIVDADMHVYQASYCPIKLIGEPKSGCGIWSASGEGSLEVYTEVTGSARWQVSSPIAECTNSGCNPPRIQVFESCAELTGDVMLTAGRFQVGDGSTEVATFCTTGDLDAIGTHAEEKSARNPYILVGHDSVAQFGGSCSE